MSLFLACSSDPPVFRETPPVIESVSTATPLLEGSELRVLGLRFDALGPNPALDVEGVRLELVESPAPGELVYQASRELIANLDVGENQVVLRLRGFIDSEDFPITVQMARDLPVSLAAFPGGDVHHNDLVVIEGGGFLASTEGTVIAEFEGMFTPDGEAARPVNASLPVTQLDRGNRDRGVLRMTTAISGLAIGSFDGSVTLRSQPVGGAESESDSLPLQLRFVRPELFAVMPTTASLGQIFTVGGAGFLGGPDEPDEATIFRIEGTFTPEGRSPVPVPPTDLVLQWISGSEVAGFIRFEERQNRLISSVFRAAEGRFEGFGTPVVVKGVQELAGEARTFDFTLAPIKQVVFLRFVTPFYDSLTRFGLAASAGIIEGLVQERMERIYSDWEVEIRLEEPRDFVRDGYAILEIGGPDLNGFGLFGYDNTPGKDVGNVRLGDSIGGANAETLEDNSPGYGGVFVESMLYFSSHPDLPGPVPAGAPDPDPLFDEI
ncbi:MAG: hypothetical protein AAGF12_40925, partial [Myxococcota bacterium]